MTTPLEPLDFESFFDLGVQSAGCHKSSNFYLTEFLLRSITNSLSTASTLMPLKTVMNETKIIWNEYHLHCSAPLPTNGSSRIVTQHISQDCGMIARYGVAFSAKYGFAQTAEGRETCVQQLKSIRDCLVECLIVDAVTALINCAHSSTLSMHDVETFAEIQKSETGWEDLRLRALGVLNAHGIAPDTWVVDEAVKSYTSPSDCLIYEAPLNAPFEPPALTNILRKRVVGEFTVQRGSNVEQNITIYDEDRDDFTEISLLDGLNHSQRFDNDGKLAAYNFKQGLENDGSDMFFTEAHPAGVQYFAQMDALAMPLGAISNWTESVLHQFAPDERLKLNASLEMLTRLVAKLDAAPTATDAYADAYFEYVNKAYQHPVIGTLSLHPLMTLASGDSFWGVTPYGFGSYEGLCELASYREDQLEISSDARRAIQAVDTLFKKLKLVCHENLFFEDGLSPACLFRNILHRRMAPVAHKGTITSLTCSDTLAAYLHADLETDLAKDESWTDLAWFSTDALVDARTKNVCQASSSVLERAVAIAFIGNTVTEQTLTQFVTTGCALPFNIIYARPYQSYNMASAACFKRGANTGETLIGHLDFQLIDDTVEKIHNGILSVYSKSVVHNKDHIYVAKDMFCKAYNGGAGTRFFKNVQDHDASMVRGCSLFALLVPYTPRAYVNPVDLTGKDGAGACCTSADFYRKVWGWNEKTVNTVCFQGHQSTKHPVKGEDDIVIKNTGHWGPRVYAGVGRARVGTELFSI